MSEDKDSRTKRTKKTSASTEAQPTKTRSKKTDTGTESAPKPRRSTSKAKEPVTTGSEVSVAAPSKRTRAKKAEVEPETKVKTPPSPPAESATVSKEGRTTSTTRAKTTKTKTEAVTETESPTTVTVSEESKSKGRPPSKAKKSAKTAEPKKTVSAKPQGTLTQKQLVQSRLWRIACTLRHRQPAFRHDQAHRWLRVPSSWRKIRGNDNNARRHMKGKVALASPGYRKPVITRAIHPSGYVEVLVSRPVDMNELNPQIHAIRIAGTVGEKKRQEIIKRAEDMSLRVLNPGVRKGAKEEELFTGLEELEEKEVEKK